MSRVMKRVPGVEPEHAFEGPFAGFGVDELFLKIGVGHRIEQPDPAFVDRVGHAERNVDRQFSVAKLGPAVFVIRLDGRRRVLGQREFEANKSVRVAVRHVMHSLPDRPAAGAIFGIELSVVQSRDGVS